MPVVLCGMFAVVQFSRIHHILQVVKLCRMHRLYSALTYILTRGLDDYVAPAVELLLALADASGKLTSLRLCFERAWQCCKGSLQSCDRIPAV